jgi:hypothetical protein
LLRAIIATALLGHWVANALADPGEYAAVGLRYEGRALYPILIQTALAVLAIAALSVLAGTRAHLAPAAEHLSRRLLTVIVVSVQVALVAGFEVTERIGIGEAYAQAFREGLFDRGFALELGIALLSAILLVALTLALAHVVRAIRRRPITLGRSTPNPLGRPADKFARRPSLVVGGGVRAPPASALTRT